ncbi:MAG: outer membrane protein assembly factor BamA, partial [Pseudomonadota bacterium]
AFNPLMVSRAEKRLKALGFFKSVQVRRRPGSQRDRVVLEVLVEEQPTGELSFGAGYSTAEGVIGDIGFTERNLFGNGQFLKVKLAGSLERFQIDMSFTEPRFLDRNLSAGFDLFHKEVDQSDQSSYKSKKTGGALRLGFPLAEKLWMNTRYTLTRDEVTVDGSNPSLAITQAASEGAYYTSALGMTIQYDARNHPRNPNRGWFASGSVDVAGLGGDTQYVRVGGEVRGYYPIFTDVTLVGRAIGGHIQGWGGDDVRLLDLYYKGGETIRGFARSGIGPRDPNGDAIGGTTFWATTAEVRFPFPFIPDELGMTGAVFADAGAVFGASDFAKAQIPGLADSSEIRSSVGVSLLWSSPIGPVRFDYAFPLSSADEDEEQPFRFGASTKF